MSIKDGGPAFTPGPWPLGEINEHLGYDCMTSGIRIGPVYLDGAQYGQKACRDLPDEGRERMLADARLIAAALDMYEALKATLRELTACANQLAALGYASRDGGSVHSAQQEARAALAKAGGQ